MRWPFLLLAVAACDGPIDPRPVCPWAVQVLDETDGHVDLKTSTAIACREPATSPDMLFFDAFVIKGEPVLEKDLEVFCEASQMVTAFEVRDLQPGALAYRPWQPDQPGTVGVNDASLAIQDAWFLVQYLQTEPDGSMSSESGWMALFQLGVEGSALSFDDVCDGSKPR